MEVLNFKHKEVVTKLYLLHFETLDFFMKKKFFLNKTEASYNEPIAFQSVVHCIIHYIAQYCDK